MKAAAAAEWLLRQHEQRRRFEPLPADFSPRLPDEAYAIQDAFVALRARKLGGISGYKIALDRLKIHSAIIQGDALVVDVDGDISIR